MNNTRTKERRRFFRVPAKIGFHFVQSHEDISEANKSFIDFFTDDIGYTPYCFEDYVKNRKASFEIDIAGYLSNKPEHKEIEDALWTLSKKIKLLEKALMMISNGESPYNNRVFKSQFQALSAPIEFVDILVNPKAKEVITNFDIKILYFFELVDRIVENSERDELYSESFESEFDIEYNMISLRRAYKLNHSVLAKLFIHLYEHMEEITRVFNDVINGHAISKKPELWNLREINFSAGGIGFHTTYRLERDMILDVFFSLDGIKDRDGKTKTMHKKVKVIHIEELPENYYVGTMLLGVKSKEIDLLNAFVFNLEITESMDFIAQLPEDDLL